MQCPKCKSSQNKKNGFRRGKQSYKCKDCGCQYVENPISRGYTSQVKQICLKMYLNGMGFRAIARVREIDHSTIINWVRQEGEALPDEPSWGRNSWNYRDRRTPDFCWSEKEQILDLDSGKSLESRNYLMEYWRPLSSDVWTNLADNKVLGKFLVCHWWLLSLS